MNELAIIVAQPHYRGSRKFMLHGCKSIVAGENSNLVATGGICAKILNEKWLLNQGIHLVGGVVSCMSSTVFTNHPIV